MRRLLGVALATALAAGSAAGGTSMIAADGLTLFARPTVAGPEQAVLLSGSARGARPGEAIDIQARDCGQGSFRNAGGAHAGIGGDWSTEYFPGINTTLRAVWRGNTSRAVSVRQRASVRLRTLPSASKRFEVIVVAKTSFWRKRVLFQRLAGTWQTVKSIMLSESRANPGAAYIWSTAKFSTSLPRGTRVRVLLPLSQARPCYVGGASRLLRVS